VRQTGERDFEEAFVKLGFRAEPRAETNVGASLE
jgi:hypothetical protein